MTVWVVLKMRAPFQDHPCQVAKTPRRLRVCLQDAAEPGNYGKGKLGDSEPAAKG